MIRNRRHALPFLFALLAFGLAALLGGCGGSDDTTEVTVTKATFISEADKICSQSDKAQEAKLNVLGEKVKQTGKPLGDEELILQAGLPPLKKAVEELAELQTPEDNGQAEAIVADMEAAIKKTEQDPKSLVDAQNPFTPVTAKARAYGLKVCGAP
jgi:hypothetical protein